MTCMCMCSMCMYRCPFTKSGENASTYLLSCLALRPRSEPPPLRSLSLSLRRTRSRVYRELSGFGCTIGQRPQVQVGQNTQCTARPDAKFEHLRAYILRCSGVHMDAARPLPLVQSHGQVLTASVSRFKLQDTRSSPELWPSAT